MTDHTPEPWHWDYSREDIMTPNGILPLIGISTPLASGIHQELAKDNAQRIIACVNVLAGLPTEMLLKLATLSPRRRFEALSAICTIEAIRQKGMEESEPCGNGER